MSDPAVTIQSWTGEALRQRFGLSQVELAQVLRLGANTVSRWESGRNTQSASMDLLLRVLRDLPGARRFLGEQSAEG